MIIAVANHDAATASNLEVCAEILQLNLTSLSGGSVCRKQVIALLQQLQFLDLFFIGHGSTSSCVGSDNNTLFDINDCSLLSQRRTFALACHTADKLGKAISATGGIWCGFVGSISCLPCDADIIHLFKKIPRFVTLNLSSIKDKLSADIFMLEFFKLLTNINDELDSLAIGSLEPYVAVDLYKRRLRIWLQHASDPVAGKEATEPASYF